MTKKIINNFLNIQFFFQILLQNFFGNRISKNFVSEIKTQTKEKSIN